MRYQMALTSITGLGSDGGSLGSHLYENRRFLYELGVTSSGSTNV